MTDFVALTSRCVQCGADLPLWFDPAETVYDVADDDVAYAAWLDTACPSCGSTPRENGLR